MILVVLRALGMVVFLVYFFWGHLRWFLLSVLGLVAFIVSVALQAALMEYRGHGDFVEAASRIGWAILIFAVTVLVVDLAAMIIHTIRRGESADQKGKVITEDRPLSSMSLGIPPPMGWSTRKILGSKSEFISMESLVDGTATFAERMMVLGNITVFISFFLIWVGLGLILMKNILIFVLTPVLPGLWVYYNLRDDWRYYQEAKKRVAARRRGEQVDAPSEESHIDHAAMRPSRDES